MSSNIKTEGEILVEQLEKEVAEDLKNEPYLMSTRRVEELLDVKPTTRKRMTQNGDLISMKKGKTQQSPVKITKTSVINCIVNWKLHTEHGGSEIDY